MRDIISSAITILYIVRISYIYTFSSFLFSFGPVSSINLYQCLYSFIFTINICICSLFLCTKNKNKFLRKLERFPITKRMCFCWKEPIYAIIGDSKKKYRKLVSDIIIKISFWILNKSFIYYQTELMSSAWLLASNLLFAPQIFVSNMC